ncbi:MAG: DUF3667 domain-containing protein [Bacteroidota bacterium]
MDCKNCQFTLNEDDKFCNNCGAKVIRNRLTVKNLWGDFCEQFLNYDNRFLKTFFGIFTQPQEVIGAYINGTRKKYVNVLSYFAIALTFSGIQIFIIRKFFPESLDLSSFVPDSVPKESLDVNWVYDYLSIFALLNLPFYGLVGRLTFIGLKKFNYTEHLVIMTYLVAQFSITNTLVLTPLIAIFDLNFYIIGNIANLLLMAFTAYTYKKLYPLSLGGTILRTFGFFGILIGFFIILSVVQVAIAIISAGGFEEYLMEVREQQQKLKEATSYIISSAINWTS